MLQSTSVLQRFPALAGNVGSHRTDVWLGHRTANVPSKAWHLCVPSEKNMTKAILPRIPHDSKGCSGTRAAPECLCSVSEQSTRSCHSSAAQAALPSPLRGKKKFKKLHIPTARGSPTCTANRIDELKRTCRASPNKLNPHVSRQQCSGLPSPLSSLTQDASRCFHV